MCSWNTEKRNIPRKVASWKKGWVLHLETNVYESWWGKGGKPKQAHDEEGSDNQAHFPE